MVLRTAKYALRLPDFIPCACEVYLRVVVREGKRNKISCSYESILREPKNSVLEI